jgi:hypothetical protein
MCLCEASSGSRVGYLYGKTEQGASQGRLWYFLGLCGSSCIQSFLFMVSPSSGALWRYCGDYVMIWKYGMNIIITCLDALLLSFCYWPCSAGHVSVCFSLFQLILSQNTVESAETGRLFHQPNEPTIMVQMACWSVFGRGKNATSDMWYDTDVTGVNYAWCGGRTLRNWEPEKIRHCLVINCTFAQLALTFEAIWFLTTLHLSKKLNCLETQRLWSRHVNWHMLCCLYYCVSLFATGLYAIHWLKEMWP